MHALLQCQHIYHAVHTEIHEESLTNLCFLCAHIGWSAYLLTQPLVCFLLTRLVLVCFHRGRLQERMVKLISNMN